MNKEIQTLLQKVKEMRTLQKKYFATRDKNVLQQSKQSEKEVDSLLQDIEKPNLFQQDEKD